MSTSLITASALGGILASLTAITGIEKGRRWNGLLFIFAAALAAGLISGLGFFLLNPEIQAFSFCLVCQNDPVFHTVPETGIIRPISASIGATLGAGLTLYFIEPETTETET